MVTAAAPPLASYDRNPHFALLLVAFPTAGFFTFPFEQLMGRWLCG